MKAFVSFFCTGLLLAASLPAAAAIDEVTVYRNGQAAVVGHYPLNAVRTKNGEYRIDGISGQAIADSIRLTADGLQLAGVRVEKQVGDDTDAIPDDLQQQLKDLQKKQAKLKAERSYTTTIEKLVLASASAKQLASVPDAGRIKALATLRQQAALKQLTYDQQLKELKKQIDKLQQRIDQYGQQQKYHYSIRFSLDGNPAKNTQVELTYRVRGVNWHPAYSLYVDTTNSSMQLVRRVAVHQTTGLNWKNVKLVLSSEQPTRGEPAEKMGTWQIGLASPKQEVAKAPRFKAMSMARAPEALYAARDAAGSSVQTQLSGFAVQYLVKSASVPSKDGWTQLQLGTLEQPVELYTLVRPQHKQAWLWLKTKLTTAKRLPAGPVKRYRDGAYLGESQLAHWSKGETRRIALGEDRQLAITHTLQENKGGDTGLFGMGSDRKLRKRFAVSLTNHHANDWPLVVEYRIPVPTDDAITVTPQGDIATSHWKLRDEQPGVYVMKQTIKADAKWQATLGYDISWPEGKKLTGISVPGK